MAAATISVCSTGASCFKKTTTALARSLITHSKMAEAEAKPVAPNADVLKWPKIDNRRLLHAVYRVGNLDRSIKFYTETLGMKLLRKKDIPEEKYSNAFLGFGPEESQFVLKLTYNYGVSSYDVGTGFGHFAIATPDAEKLMEDAVAKGANVFEFLGDMLDGRRVIGFVEDPDGYTFEIFHTDQPSTPQPLSQVMIRVCDLERSIKFYENALGLKLLWKIVEREQKFGVAIMGYAEANQTTIFELMYNDGENTKGNAYAHVAISTDDVYKSAEAVNLVTQELGGKITRQPGPIPGLNTKITSFLDPDGWKIVLVDNEDFLKELQQ